MITIADEFAKKNSMSISVARLRCDPLSTQERRSRWATALCPTTRRWHDSNQLNRKRIVGVEPGVSVRSFVALRKRRANFIDGAQMKERAVGG